MMTKFLLMLHIILHLVLAFSSFSYSTTWACRTAPFFFFFLQVLFYMFEYYFSELKNVIPALFPHTAGFLDI